MNLPLVFAVAPFRLGILRVRGSALELPRVKVYDIAAQGRVVSQHRPREGMIVIADPEKAAKRHDGIGDVPGFLVDHEVVNRTQVLAGSVIDRCSLHLIGGNERAGFSYSVHVFPPAWESDTA